jgi:hypothetical protein
MSELDAICWFLAVFLAASTLDTWLYIKSGGIEKDRRDRFWFYMLPGSGFVAWFRRRRKA